MSEFKERLAADAKRVEAWAKQAEVTAVIAVEAVMPSIGQAVRQADLASAKTAAEFSQVIQRNEQEDVAESELQIAERKAGELYQVPQSDPPTRQDPPRERPRQPRRLRDR